MFITHTHTHTHTHTLQAIQLHSEHELYSSRSSLGLFNGHLGSQGSSSVKGNLQGKEVGLTGVGGRGGGKIQTTVTEQQ